MPYDFSLDREATITLSAGSVVLLVLVFVAGVLTGLTWRSPEQGIIAARMPAAPEQKAMALNQGAAGTQTNRIAAASATTAPQTAAPISAPATQAAQPGAITTPAPAPAAAGAATSAPAAQPAGQAPAAQPAEQAPAAVSSAPAIQLAIQVGAFLDKANADKLVERLKEAGYTPQIVLSGHPPRQWNFVRVGPYHDWGEATEIAAVLSRDEDTQAIVRPMR